MQEPQYSQIIFYAILCWFSKAREWDWYLFIVSKGIPDKSMLILNTLNDESKIALQPMQPPTTKIYAVIDLKSECVW